jgi:threonine dehydratase
MLSKRIGNRVLPARTVAAFSSAARAYNKMARCSPSARGRRRGHGGVVLAAQRLGCKAMIVMPVTTPSIKIAAVEARGQSGSTATLQRRLRARPGAAEGQERFVHPYDDPYVTAQGRSVKCCASEGPIDAISPRDRRRRADFRHCVLRQASDPRSR